MKATHTLKTNALMLLSAIIWGFAFVAQRKGMEHIGPFLFNGVRFALGSLVLLPIIRHRRRPRRGGYGGALLAGVVLFLGATLQQTGIIYTTAGNAGFITGLYVIIVPLLGLLWRQWSGPGTWLGAILAVAGLFLLSETEGLALARGDTLVLASALFWALHVHVIGFYASRIDPIELAAVQFACCSLLSMLGALITEPIHGAPLLAAAGPILYAGLLSTGVAYTLQVVAQREAHPSHAAIILSTEAVFAVIGGLVFLHEGLTLRGAAGCLLMLAGMLLSQLYTQARRRR